MLSVVTWLWRTPSGPSFGPEYVNKLRRALERNLRIPHELVVVTNDTAGIERGVRFVKPPPELPGAIRCRRRMWQFAAERAADFGSRVLAIDLDVVIVDDITPLVSRPEPIVCWKVGYANVFSGSFMLFDVGALDGAWQAYKSGPVSYPMKTGEKAASDQAMLNLYLKGRTVPHWTEADGIRTWFGAGYESKEHFGMGPRLNVPPKGTRIVVMGSADKAVMDEGRYEFVRKHWV